MTTVVDRSSTRTKLLDATLRIVAKEGFRAATHRKIAAEAGVSLSATSYHFSTIEAMLFEAMAHFVSSMSKRWAGGFNDVRSEDQAVEAVVRIVTQLHREPRDVTILYELYAQGSRDADYQRLIATWSDSTMADLAKYYPQDVVVKTAAVWEGFIFLASIVDYKMSQQLLRSAVHEVLTGQELSPWPEPAPTSIGFDAPHG